MKNNEIKSGALLGYLNMFANIIVTLLYTPIMINLLGQSEYGLYSLVASVISYLSVLDMGFGNAMIRFVSRSQAKKDKKQENQINGMFIFLYSIIGIVALIIGIVLALNIELIFKSSLTPNELIKCQKLMMILVFTVAISFPLSVFDSYVIANEKFKFIKIMNIIKTIMQPIAILCVLYLGYKSIAMVILTSFFTILFHIINLVYCRKELDMKITIDIKNFDKKLLKEIAYYSFFIFLNIVVDNLYNNTDQVILGGVSGTIAVSIYAVATKISSMNTTFSTTINGLFLPRITKTLEEENGEKKVSDMFIKVSRIQLYIMALILSAFIVFGKQFLNMWVGQEYRDAYYIILLLIGPAIIPLTQNIGITIIQAKNKHAFRSIVYIMIAILNIFISIPLAQKYGGIGAAIGTAIATILGQIITMNLYYWKKIKLNIPKYWKNVLSFMLPISIITTIAYLVINSVNLNWITLGISGIIYILPYLLICYIYANDEEKQFVFNILSKLRRKK